MGKLSEAEQALLDKLTKKAEAPDAPSIGKSVSVTLDLGNPEQVALAIKHGFLSADEITDIEGEDDKKPEADETPRRKGYFGD